MNDLRSSLLAMLQAHGQEQLLAHWDRLTSAQQANMASQIRAINFAQVARLYQARNVKADYDRLASAAQSPRAVRLEPCSTAAPGCADSWTQPRAAVLRGEEALRAGQVGVILVAGGQGTRLGFPHPKGMFPIGPVSQRTLFQIHVEKVVATARRYGKPVPLYLMTSPATHDATAAFFAEHANFGLPSGDLAIFCQGTMPAVDESTGKVLLEAPDRIALSPDGHGGTLAALARSGALADVERRGVKHLFFFQVDNPMVDVAAPEFLGYHLLSGAEMTTQVVAKKEPEEKVGNVVQVDGRLQVIEYSDLAGEYARRRLPDRSLRIWAGSIAVHAMEVAFLVRASGQEDALPFHYARKKVAYVDASGQVVRPEEENAVKFERFIFDLLPLARNALVVEIDPRIGFAPLKNASGAQIDTPEYVRERLAARYADWLRRAGAELAEGAIVEISPLFALDAAEVARKIKPGAVFRESTCLSGTAAPGCADSPETAGGGCATF